MDIQTGWPSKGAGEMPVGAPSPAAGVADDLAQERFREAMDGPGPVQDASPKAGPATELAKGSTLGDAILSGVSQLSSDFQHAWAQKHHGLNSDMNTWSAAQLVQFQAHVQTSSALLDVMGKGVSKVVQGIEQITKTQ